MCTDKQRSVFFFKNNVLLTIVVYFNFIQVDGEKWPGNKSPLSPGTEHRWTMYSLNNFRLSSQEPVLICEARQLLHKQGSISSLNCNQLTSNPSFYIRVQLIKVKLFDTVVPIKALQMMSPMFLLQLNPKCILPSVLFCMTSKFMQILGKFNPYVSDSFILNSSHCCFQKQFYIQETQETLKNTYTMALATSFFDWSICNVYY